MSVKNDSVLMSHTITNLIPWPGCHHCFYYHIPKHQVQVTTTTTTMPELTLIYYNSRGRAELARWIMAYGDIKYTDDRIERKDWPTRKPRMSLTRLSQVADTQNSLIKLCLHVKRYTYLIILRYETNLLSLCSKGHTFGALL